MASPVELALGRAWRSTCKVLFGQETAPLSDCAEWLREYDDILRVEKSSLSGKPVAFSLNEYAKRARFIGFDEVDPGRKFEPLSINEMKDVDGIVGALSERACYAGNIVLGHSSHAQNSSNVADSHYVIDSTVVSDSKYIGYSRYVKESEYCFGLLGSERVIHAVKCMGSELKRCFECHMVQVLSDCYYCAKTQNCRECMFCFGLENGAYCIGNTALARDKYLPIKRKLLSEMAQALRKDGRLFSVLDIVVGAGRHKPDPRLKFKKGEEPPFDPKPVEAAFEKTTRLLFGRALPGMAGFGAYLDRHVPQNLPKKSALSGEPSIMCSYRKHIAKMYDLTRRLATDDELRKIGAIGIGEEEAARLEMNLCSLVERLHPIAYTNMDKITGKNSNYHNATVVMNAQDVCNGSSFSWCKKCAHCTIVTASEALFGSALLFDSSFCMKCYYSKNLTRAFEADTCESCSDIYFAHNCENVRDSMFCFNAKNLAHAIGNAELPADEYKRVKASLVAQMADELEKKHDLKWDIFNIGGKISRS